MPADPARQPRHIPVLLDAVVRLLAPCPGETAVDCTAGAGGHAAAIASALGPEGTLILNDLDPANLAIATVQVEALPAPPRLVSWQGNFVDVPRRMTDAGLAADVVLADLGFASSQVDDPARGFSFHPSREGPLDMRFDPAGPVTAAELVNRLDEAELAEIIRDFGEERHARAVARKLVAERAAAPIQTTSRLASIVRSVVGERSGPARPGQRRIDPATRTFQALRIAVNDEMGSLASLLESVSRAAAHAGRAPQQRPGAPTLGAGTWLKPGARVGVISFHSLEDRQVKRAFAEVVERGLAESLTARPAEAGEEECRVNPRARSARLRVIRLKGDGA